MASRLNAVVEEESAFYRIIRSVLVAHLHGNAAQISVEIGRGSVPSASQPSFAELETALGGGHPPPPHDGAAMQSRLASWGTTGILPGGAASARSGLSTHFGVIDVQERGTRSRAHATSIPKGLGT